MAFGFTFIVLLFAGSLQAQMDTSSRSANF